MGPHRSDAADDAKRNLTGQYLGSHRVLSVESRRRVVRWAQRNGVFFALLVLAVLLAITTDRFLLPSNLRIVALQISVIGIIAIPGALLVLSGYVDLSVGSVMVLSAVAFGQFVENGVPVGWAAIIGLSIGLAWGFLINGYLISYLSFSPIVVTLAGLALARGLAEAWSQGVTVFDFGPAFGVIGIGRWLDVPVPVWIFLFAVLCGHYVWNVGPWGRRITAIGSAPDSAISLGVSVKPIILLLYGASGLAAAVGGLIMTAQLDGASLSIGVGIELDVLTAILLGGVSFTGGRGHLLGVLTGLLFLGILRNGLVHLGVGVFWYRVAIGAALLFGAVLDAVYRRLERVEIQDHDVAGDLDLDEAVGAE